MGIRFNCPNGHKLHVKEYLAGRRAVCPSCGAKLTIPPAESAESARIEPSRTESPAPVVESPSVVIPVFEAPVIPQVGPAAQPPDILPQVLPTLGGVEGPTVPPNVSMIAIQRRNRRRTQTKLAILLFVTVIILAIVLVWVLSRNAGLDEPVEAATPARVAQEVGPHYAALDVYVPAFSAQQGRQL